jgi:hypothetical protein
MATLKPTVSRFANHTVMFAYGPLTSADADGHPIPGEFNDYADRTVEIDGTFGAGTVHWEGSNRGVNYTPLTDPQGGAISKTVQSIEQVTENAALQRPRVSGADGATSVFVTVICRRGRGGKEI